MFEKACLNIHRVGKKNRKLSRYLQHSNCVQMTLDNQLCCILNQIKLIFVSSRENKREHHINCPTYWRKQFYHHYVKQVFFHIKEDIPRYDMLTKKSAIICVNWNDIFLSGFFEQFGVTKTTYSQ